MSDNAVPNRQFDKHYSNGIKNSYDKIGCATGLTSSLFSGFVVAVSPHPHGTEQGPLKTSAFHQIAKLPLKAKGHIIVANQGSRGSMYQETDYRTLLRYIIYKEQSRRAEIPFSDHERRSVAHITY